MFVRIYLQGGYKMLTEKQRIALNAINEYIQKEKISPTVRELCGILGFSSTSTVHRYLGNLEEKGYITRKKESPRSIRVLKEYDM
jgi:SOS-response transcriptional repressor LexA